VTGVQTCALPISISSKHSADKSCRKTDKIQFFKSSGLLCVGMITENFMLIE